MSDETTGAPASGAAEGTAGEPPTLEQFLSEFRSYKEALDGRITLLGRDLGKERERRKALEAELAKGKPRVEPPDPGANGHPTGATPADFSAFMRLERVRAKLPESAHAKIDEWIDAGVSPAEALARAEALAEFVQVGSDSRPPKINGAAASAAPRSSVAHPTTRREWLALYAARAKGDREAAKRIAVLESDPSFDGKFER